MSKNIGEFLKTATKKIGPIFVWNKSLRILTQAPDQDEPQATVAPLPKGVQIYSWESPEVEGQEKPENPERFNIVIQIPGKPIFKMENIIAYEIGNTKDILPEEAQDPKTLKEIQGKVGQAMKRGDVEEAELVEGDEE